LVDKLLTWWEIEENRAIKLTKMRIKHHEKHGCGNSVIKDKETLKLQERHKSLRTV